MSIADKLEKTVSKRVKLTAALVLASMLTWACAKNPKPAADQEADTFLSEVRYLITRSEIKQFKKLPPADREGFIAAFWKIRDPDPATEENEFRDEYYQRIEKANRLFREGGAGWLTDRGRIFILIGEPDRRDVYPSGYSFYEPPVEIWFYGFYTILFIDHDRENVYRLSTASAQALNTINRGQMGFKPKGLVQKGSTLEYSLTYIHSKGKKSLRLKIPFNGLAFDEKKEKDLYTTRLQYTLSISSDQGQVVSEQKDTLDITVTPSDFLKENGAYAVDLALDLSPGRYRAVLNLLNEADKMSRGQSMTFKVK